MATGVRETDSGYKRRAKQIVKEGKCENFNLEWEKRGGSLQKDRERSVCVKSNEERNEIELEKEGEEVMGMEGVEETEDKVQRGGEKKGKEMMTLN